MGVRYDWRVSTAPVRKQLTGIESAGDVVVASGRDGVLLERVGSGDWRGLFLEGATGNGRGVLDVSLTTDRKRAWFCGISGTFGYYDRERGTAEAHPGPYDLTSEFRSLSVRGAAGEESVHVVDANGRVIRMTVDGATPTVNGVAIPGSGAAFTDVVDDGSILYAADESGLLYYSEDGRRWRTEHLAETTVVGLALDDGGLAAVADGGTLYRGVDVPGNAAATRRRLSISSPNEVSAAGRAVAVAGGGGALFVGEDGDPTARAVGTNKSLADVEVREDGAVFAVGNAGTLVEGMPVGR